MRKSWNGSKGRTVGLFIAVTAVLSAGLVLAPPSVEQASAAPPTWVGTVIVTVSTNLSDYPENVLTDSLTTLYTLAPSAADTAETTWSATYNRQFLDYDICSPGGTPQVYSNAVWIGSGEGTGADLFVNYQLGGYRVDTRGLPQFDTRVEITSTNCFGNTATSEATEKTTVAPALVVVPALEDNLWVLQASITESGGCNVTTGCTETNTGIHLRRANCTGAPDADGDGLDICEEFDLRTDPNNPDTDGGGVSDGDEVAAGTDPNDPADDADADRDGVSDWADECPGTPEGAVVNAAGCPDEDGDGVADPQDRCAGTPPGTAVNSEGCPLDSDSDGVLDSFDECPDTPEGTAVDDLGCPLNRTPDAVNDSVRTPISRAVDVNVLANDSDPDGDPISLRLCTQPANGVTSVTGSTVRFVPARGFSGVTSFTCTIADSFGATDTSTVTVRVGGGEIELNVNIDYETYWYNAVPNFSLLGRPGSDKVIIDGSSSAQLSGDADLLSLVSRVCITPVWQAWVGRNFSTVPVFWSEGGHDVTGDDNVFWKSPPGTMNGGLISVLSPKDSVCSGPGGTGVSWSTAPADLVAVTIQSGRSVNFSRIVHLLDVYVEFIDGSTYRRTVSESEKAAPRPPQMKDLSEQQLYRIRL